MIYLLFVISSFTGVLNAALIKLYRKTVSDSRLSDSLFYAVNILGALLFFAILCRFDLRVNLVTLLFSGVFACVSFLSVFLTLRALENTSMVNVSLFSSAGALILSSLAGVLLLREQVGAKRFAGLVLTLCSISVPYFAAKKSGTGLKGILFCCLIALNSGACNIIMKLYHTVPGCLDENIFCFYTNVLMIPFVLFRHRQTFFSRKSLQYMNKALCKPLLTALAAVLMGYIATLLSMYVVGKVDLLFASAFGPPLTICFNFLFDTFVFREPVKADKIITILLAIAAIVFLV